MDVDMHCKYCEKVVCVSKNHIQYANGELAHISCNEEFNSYKYNCDSCDVEIVIIRSYVLTEKLRIKKSGVLIRKSNFNQFGEGTPAHNARCEKCGKQYDFVESNSVYKILGKREGKEL